MTTSWLVPALLLWRGVRFGPLRLSAYGLCAAVGLVLGMALSRRVAGRWGLDSDAVWDAGLVAVMSCFLASRLLLVLGNPAAFVHYPLVVLGSPSLTFGGMALAALMVVAYVRVKKLPWRSFLDAFAAPAAVLAACLELGHWLEGSEAGMPTTLPWGVHEAAYAAGARLHPVSLYGAGLAVLLGLLFLFLPPTLTAGQLAALGLLLGGLGASSLDMLTQPSTRFGASLEPGQVEALLVLLAGALLWTLAPRRSELLSTAAQDIDGLRTARSTELPGEIR